eukprot:Nk52_evm1s1992 gene=Nk52_evmTU1s1992
MCTAAEVKSTLLLLAIMFRRLILESGAREAETEHFLQTLSEENQARVNSSDHLSSLVTSGNRKVHAGCSFTYLQGSRENKKWLDLTTAGESRESVPKIAFVPLPKIDSWYGNQAGEWDTQRNFRLELRMLECSSRGDLLHQKPYLTPLPILES